MSDQSESVKDSLVKDSLVNVEHQIRNLENQLMSLNYVEASQPNQPSYIELNQSNQSSHLEPNRLHSNRSFHLEQKLISRMLGNIKNLKDNLLDYQSNPNNDLNLVSHYQTEIDQKNKEIQEFFNLKDSKKEPEKDSSEITLEKIENELSLQWEDQMELKETVEIELELLKDQKILLNQQIQTQEQLIKLNNKKSSLKKKKSEEKKRVLEERKRKKLSKYSLNVS